MTDIDLEIERLTKETYALYNAGKLEQARSRASALERVLGSPTGESEKWYVHSWTIIYELRGDIQEAVRVADLDISRKRQDIADGGYELYPKLLAEDVEYLQTSLFFQAERLYKSHNNIGARECLCEIYDLAHRYGIEPDEDVHELQRSITD